MESVQHYIEGKYGRGSLDLYDAVVSLVEIKNKLFNQGMAQALIQIHITKRKMQAFRNRRPACWCQGQV